ncbi:aminotransferase class III-fold pyridoxal phosphate-dependent enzyme [Nocardia gipuzkoensis]|uniref:aminotransferase class III-fold pyridoxal phosphate-dependent enzyme n=1 Tax=Nocardia gipuzkoensis TaxID=2749991 RepID=UPI001E53E033|nr:aminotransferase class III-fold pyridoxal phosphate-dependent enzyme [Nocardia gipuzkoensis]UGT67524.1 aminotransferase class III-fold pyridoxal phosphate-dependent enzyme [Nocardia gipuzkoensis]
MCDSEDGPRHAGRGASVNARTGRQEQIPPTESDAFGDFAEYNRPGLARLLRACHLDVVYTAAEGDYLVRADGTRVLDLVGGFGAALFGHNHPALVRAATATLNQQVPFVAQGSVRPGVARLARRLSESVGVGTGREYVVTFGSTGADAVEAAIRHAAVAHARALSELDAEIRRTLRRLRRDRLHDVRPTTPAGDPEMRTAAAVLIESLDRIARLRERGPVFVSLAGAFHGKSVGAFALTEHADTPTDFVVPGPERRRLATWAPDEVAGAFADELCTVGVIGFGADGAPVRTWRRLSPVAAVFAEPVQGEGGVREVPAETLLALRQLADRHAAALVFDEIQCGMGRTGTFLASAPSGVRADYYLMSKSLGGGLVKIAALLVDRTHAVADFGRYHTSTFADDELSATVADAALDLLRDNQIRISDAGARLRSRLDEVARRWPREIVAVRGRGLLQGVQLRVPEPDSALLHEICAPDMFGYVVAGYLLHRHAIRMLPTLSAPTTLRVQPSAFVTEAGMARLTEALDDVAALLHRGRYDRLLAHLAAPVSTKTTAPDRAPLPRRADTPPARDPRAPLRVAFLANLPETADLRRLAPELASWTDPEFAALFERLRAVADPFELTRQTICSPTGAEVEMLLLALPLTAGQIVAHQRAGERTYLRELVWHAVEQAVAAGATVIGLGGYTSIVTDAAREVAEDTVTVTSGNSLTAACAYEVLSAELTALPPGQRRVGVLGALGNIGAVMAELLAPLADSLVLVGRSGAGARLRRVAAGLPGEIVVSEDLADLRDCRVVVAATNSAEPLITARHLAADHPVLICDLAVPGDVDPAVAEHPHLTLLDGGRMALPLGQTPPFPETGLPAGIVYACMAETLLLGFEPRTASPSYGALTVAGVRSARSLAARHDVRPVLLPTGATTVITPATASAPMFLGAADFSPARAGGKAATLHELLADGFAVPPGFAVPADLDLDGVSDDELADWVRAIGGFPVAVRSSGVLEDLDDASFAGQYESYLDIADPAALRTHIERCRASVRNERVRAYLSRRGMADTDATVAVLVQRMVEARCAGVGFSIDVLTGVEEHAVLETCHGVGERLVSGQVTPTRYTLRLADGGVVSRDAGDEDVQLTAADTTALAALLLAVQARRHRPQDIEWAIDGDGALWLLQSRAVTAISWRTDIDQFSDADLRDGGVSARVCTPMMFSLYDNAFQYSMQRFFEGLGLAGPGAEPDWMAMYYGRAYWNVSAVKKCFQRIPGFDEQHFDDDLGVLNEYGPDGPIRTPNTPLTIARALPVALAVQRSYREQLAAVDRFAASWPAKYEAWQERVRALPHTDEATFAADLADCLLTLHAATERTYFTTIYHNSSVQTDFKQLLDKVDAATGATSSAIDLMGGLAEISHMALQRGIVELHRVAQESGLDGPAWDDALAAFLAEQGFHADAELDLTCPRWSEDPQRVRSMIAVMLEHGTAPADPATTLVEQRKRYESELAAVRARVRARPTTRVRYAKALDKQIERMRRYLVARERMREFSSQCYAVVRAYVVEAGTRLATAGALERADDAFQLTIHELTDLVAGRVDAAALAAVLAYRRAMYAGYRDLTPPHELGGGVTVAAVRAVADGDLTGLGCSPGVAEGTARVITALSGIDQLREGDILVTRFTDPGWTPALGLVAGVVTEVGGMLSHAAVIGREYGIPAVLNVAGATNAVKSGQRIRIDGSAGVVRILDADLVAAPATDHAAPAESVADQPRADIATRAEPEAVSPPDRVIRETGTTPSDLAAAPRVPRGTGKDTTLTARKRLICLAGGDGSGKTTQVARIAAEFEAQGHSVAAVTIWDAFLDPKISSKLPWRDPAEIYGYLQLLTPLSRAHFLFHAMQLSLDLAAERGADILLANAYWYKYYATEVAHGGDPVVLRNLAAGFPEPDRTFYLAVRPQDALGRKRLRSDYESGYGDEESFLAFQQRSHEALDALSDEFGWIRLDGTAEQAEITAAVLNQLREDDR